MELKNFKPAAFILFGMFLGVVFTVSAPVIASDKITIIDVYNKTKNIKSTLAGVEDNVTTVRKNVGTVNDNILTHDENSTDQYESLENYLYYIDTNAYYACLATEYWQSCLDIFDSTSLDEETKASIKAMRDETGVSQKIQEIIDSKQ